MEIEYEATFTNINKDEVRGRLKEAGASLVRPEFLQKRVPFDLPNGQASTHAWARVRDEGDKITMSVKMIAGEGIESQKEVCLTVDSYEEAVKFLLALGCKIKPFQESKRELWSLDGADITIDEWPFLEPFVEVEGKSEDVVRTVSEKIGFDYSKALFCGIGKLYIMKYGIPPDKADADRFVFDMENPFPSTL
jgi:adenylate cyclase class 2